MTPTLDVVGLGYCSWDYLGTLDQVPEFDAPTVSLADFAISGGGPVSTALVACARLGLRTGYVGAVGDDDAGCSAQKAFADEGVDVSRLRVQPGTRSPVCICLIQAQTGKRSILCYRGTTEEVELEPADYPYITAARFLHLDGNHMGAALTAARWMHEAGGTVVLDANRPRARLDELLPWVDVLITNADFPSAYTGESDLERAADKLLSTDSAPGRASGTRVPRLVVTTLGETGCAYFTGKKRGHVAGFQVPVVDTTGAGDAFHGAFIYGMVQGWTVRRTATFANAVAAMNCTALGGRAGLPHLGEVEAFLRREKRDLASSR